MAIEVTMPKFGLTMHEGTLQRYFKSAGEAVSAGEPLYEVETEKVLYVVEAPGSGTLALWLHEEGAVVECGGVVAVIAEASEDAAGVRASHAGNAAPATNAASLSTAGNQSAGASARPGAPGSTSAVDGAAGDARRPISPVARKLAAELGVELARVNGTGPGGRITREDVERAAQAPAGRAFAQDGGPAAAMTEPPAPPAQSTEPQIIALSGMRRTISTRMHQSLRDTAQLTITSDADVTAATEVRGRLTGEFDFTYTDLIIHAVARALMRHPRMNSRLAEKGIAIFPEAHVGMAVALDDGLIVPVVHNASQKSLREIARETRELAERAKAGKLKLEDVSGGTFTVTNLGTWGVDSFTPILNSGETGILGVGRIVEKPAVYRGEIAKRAMLTLSLTFDHRVIDGAPAAAFLRTTIDILNYGDR
ncbi:MAG TPA: dihydrolipoamide acetyltransferase family protein [Candidatus Binataceae bacterium]|nr:dihydrolipoamide acetyltransferase family protein [Candidatus Binataceae bacterium]